MGLQLNHSQVLSVNNPRRETAPSPEAHRVQQGWRRAKVYPLVWTRGQAESIGGTVGTVSRGGELEKQKPEVERGSNIPGARSQTPGICLLFPFFL